MHSIARQKITSCMWRHLLLYVLFTKQSFNFINVFTCYKQEWKLAPFNLAHPCIYWNLVLPFSLTLMQNSKHTAMLYNANIGASVFLFNFERSFSVMQVLIRHFTIFQSHGLSGWFMPKNMRSCLNLSKLQPKYCWSLFSGHGVFPVWKKYVRHIGILYFRFRFRPYKDSHVILHQSANFHPDRTGIKMTSCRFSRWQISAILNFTGSIMGSLKSPCETS